MDFSNLQSVNLSSGVTADIISAVFRDIHMFSLGVAFIIFSFAVVRNYKEYGNQLGIHFLITLGVCIIMAVGVHHVTDKLMTAMRMKIEGVSDVIEGVMVQLLNIKFPEPKSFWDFVESLKVTLTLIIYSGCIAVGRTVRSVIYLLMNGIYTCLISLAPIFFAFLTIPETRSIAVNYIMHIISFILMPICFLFGDLAMLWIMDNLWKMLLCKGVVAGSVTVKSIFALKAVGASATVLSSFAIFLVAFAIAFVILSIICYAALPLIFISIFRGGSVGGVGSLITGAFGGVAGGMKAASLGMEAMNTNAGGNNSNNNSGGLGAASSAASAVKNIASASASESESKK